MRHSDGTYFGVHLRRGDKIATGKFILLILHDHWGDCFKKKSKKPPKKNLRIRNLLRVISRTKTQDDIAMRSDRTDHGSHPCSYFIRLGEMADIPLKNYTQHLVDWCLSLHENCPNTMLLISDDFDAQETLRSSLTTAGFSVKTLYDLIVDSGLRLEENVVSLHGRSPHQLPHMTSTRWDRHTRELVTSITLLAMSDYVLCTVSSNFCQLVRLLRSNSTAENFHSLDDRRSACWSVGNKECFSAWDMATFWTTNST